MPFICQQSDDKVDYLAWAEPETGVDGDVLGGPVGRGHQHLVLCLQAWDVKLIDWLVG